MHMELHAVVDTTTNRVYHVVFAEEGLYLLHVTNTDGLHDYAGGSIKFDANNKSTNLYADLLARGEEDLPENMAEDMLKNEHSRYLTFGEIRNIASTYHNPRRVTMETANNGVYTLDFKNNPPERVEKFMNLLREAVSEEQNANEELKR